MDASIALPVVLTALHFAADKHRDQRRKGAEASPYVNHLIEVAELLAREGGVTDVITLQAAILHDTLGTLRQPWKNSMPTSAWWYGGS